MGGIHDLSKNLQRILAGLMVLPILTAKKFCYLQPKTMLMLCSGNSNLMTFFNVFFLYFSRKHTLRRKSIQSSVLSTIYTGMIFILFEKHCLAKQEKMGSHHFLRINLILSLLYFIAALSSERKPEIQKTFIRFYCE